MKKNKFIFGAFVLTIGGIVCKFIGAIFRIPLSNILGAEGIGIYQLIFPIFAFALVFATAGIPTAEAKLIGEARSKQQIKLTKKIFSVSFLFLLIIGLLFSLALVLFAGNIATFVGSQKSELGFMGIGFGVLFASLVASIRGYYQGYENMKPTVISQVVEQVFKLVLGLSFAYVFVRQGVEYGVLGAVLGVLISEVIALLSLLIYSARFRANINTESNLDFSTDLSSKTIIKKLVALSFPILIGAVALPLTLMIDSLLVVNLLKSGGMGEMLATSLFGIWSGMTNSLINFPTVLSIALATALVPSISYSFAKKNFDTLKNKASLSFRLVYVVVLPCVVGFIMLAPNIMSILYPTLNSTNLAFATSILRCAAINVFYIGFLQISSAILQGIGKPVIPALNILLGCALKIALTIILVRNPLINIYGSVISSSACYFLATALNLFAVKKYARIQMGFIELFVPFILSALVGLIAFAGNNILSLINPIIKTVIIVLFCIIFYFVFIIKLKIITKNQIIEEKNE